MYYIGSMAFDPNYLAHHGIKGQKWGVRRFQNPDGTLTDAGKKRRASYSEIIGYKPVKGKNGNYVQRQMASEYMQSIKSSDMYSKKRDKLLAKSNGVPTEKTEKLNQKAAESKANAEIKKRYLKEYDKLSQDQQKKLNRKAIAYDAASIAVDVSSLIPIFTMDGLIRPFMLSAAIESVADSISDIGMYGRDRVLNMHRNDRLNELAYNQPRHTGHR